MPDAQTPAAPAASAAPATSTETVAAPAAETPPQAKAPKLKGRAAHEAIRAKLAAKAAPAGDKPADAKPDASKTEPAAEGKTAPAKDAAASTEPEAKKPAVGAVMRLTAENTKLTNELAEVRSKLEAASKAETVESLRAKVKKDPAVLLDLFGADLSEDENERLTKLNDAVLARLDPAGAADRERDAEIAALKKQLADADKAKAETAEQEKARARREHTAKVLTDGFKDDIGETIVDSSKYPYVNHLTREGVVDVHAGISATVRDLVVEFAKAQKRNPTDAEIAKFIAISAEQAEQHFAAQARKWQLPNAATPAPAPTETRPAVTTIGSGLGNRTGAVDTSKLSPRERHALIRERLRAANRNAN